MFCLINMVYLFGERYYLDHPDYFFNPLSIHFLFCEYLTSILVVNMRREVFSIISIMQEAGQYDILLHSFTELRGTLHYLFPILYNNQCMVNPMRVINLTSIEDLRQFLNTTFHPILVILNINNNQLTKNLLLLSLFFGIICIFYTKF